MKHNARLWQCMTPRNRVDGMELFLTSTAASLEVSHFGSALMKNRGTVARIAGLLKEKDTCVVEAAHLGFDATSLARGASELKAELQASGNGRQPIGGDELHEFVKLSIVVPLLKGPELLDFSPLFLWDKTGVKQARGAIAKMASRLAKLLSSVSLLTKLRRMGYKTEDQSWLSLADFVGVFSAVRTGEKHACQDVVEALVQEYDHCCAELKRESLRIDEIARLKSRCDGIRNKVASYMRLFVWWDGLSAATARADDGWDAKADALMHSMFHESSRHFPWHDASSGGATRPPRWLLLKFLEISEELERSEEQRDTFSPYALKRSITYFDLYVRNAQDVLSSTTIAIAEKVTAIRGGDVTAVAEMHLLLYRRAYLSKRLGELRERQAQGREAVANWYAKGKPIDLGVADASIAGSDATATYVEEDDVLGETVLAAGAADRAAEAALADVEPTADGDAESESESGSESDPE